VHATKLLFIQQQMCEMQVLKHYIQQKTGEDKPSPANIWAC